MDKRGPMSRNRLATLGGPDHKTIERILLGKPVHRSTLAKLATGLSAEDGYSIVEVADIPND
jgi:hypothetical protein